VATGSARAVELPSGSSTTLAAENQGALDCLSKLQFSFERREVGSAGQIRLGLTHSIPIGRLVRLNGELHATKAPRPAPVSSAGSGAVWRDYIALRYNEKELSGHDRILGMGKLSLADYRALAEFRYQIRKFFSFSDRAVEAAGLERGQYQLMLAIKGMPAGMRPRIRDLAQRLQVQHNSAVELINRLEAGGYVRRERAEDDRREVLLLLTAKGEKVLAELALHHHEELQEAAPRLVAALHSVMNRNLRSVMKGKQRARRLVARDGNSA